MATEPPGSMKKWGPDIFPGLTSTPSPLTKRHPASTAPWSDLYFFLRVVSVALACGLTFFLRAGSATNFQALPPLGGSWYGVCETILTSSLHYCSSETAPRSTRGPPRDVRPWNGQLTTPAASSRPSSAPAPPSPQKPTTRISGK